MYSVPIICLLLPQGKSRNATWVAAESEPDFDGFYSAPYRFWQALEVGKKCMCYGWENPLHPTTEELRSTSVFGIPLILVFYKEAINNWSDTGREPYAQWNCQEGPATLWSSIRRKLPLSCYWATRLPSSRRVSTDVECAGCHSIASFYALHTWIACILFLWGPIAPFAWRSTTTSRFLHGFRKAWNHNMCCVCLHSSKNLDSYPHISLGRIIVGEKD